MWREKHEQEQNIWSKKETLTSKKASLSCPNMGDCKDQTESKNSSSAAAMAKTEAQDKVSEIIKCQRQR
jgi:hypothetical protein